MIQPRSPGSLSRLLGILIAAFALPLSAATYVVPSDAEMIQTSDDIVIATGVGAVSERDAHGGIVTRYTLRVVETLKGDRAAGEYLVVTELGGAIGDSALAVPGAPEYEPGVRYLVFTSTNNDGETITFGMSLGQFRLIDSLAIRREIHGFDQNLEEHDERARDAQRFAAYIRDTVARRGHAVDYFVPHAREAQIAAEWKIAANAFTLTSYLLQSDDGRGFRWQNPSVSWVRAGTQAGTANAPESVSVAFSQWNSTATNIDLSDAGVDNTATGGIVNPDNKNAVLFGDPNRELPSGVAGKGGISAGGQHTAHGETFWSAAQADVVIAAMSFQQSCLNTVMTHEIGHTLGFRHANIPSPGEICGSTAHCSGAAIMYSSALCGFNGVLQTYDITAAETVYGDGGGSTPTCPAPRITNQPGDQTINSGQIAVLSLGASGGTVKWYRGTLGDKSNQIGITGSVVVGPLTATTKYWAEVANACGAIGSRQVTVTVRALPEIVPMLNGRFSVQVRYRNQFDNNRQGKLLGRSLFSSASSETAVFTFGDVNVIELLVRLSDARPFDDHIHVFLGGLSDVELIVIVSDSASGIVREYRKAANQLVGIIDRTTYPAQGGSGQGAGGSALKIAPDAETSTIGLLNDRFQVRVRYRNQFTNPASTGYLNARSIASTSTTETAVFFFGENAGSAEWMVRFSDARPFANRIDLFHGGLTDVELTIEVLDTKTGARKEYGKGAFSLSGLVDRTSYEP